MRGGIYLDNASTSFPKPGIIGETIELYLRDAGCSPGRSGHARARISEKLINDARQKIADILGVGDHSKIAYTHNATYALNIAIKGYLSKGDHVITTCFEHNSVLRPLEKLRRNHVIDYSVIGLNNDLEVDFTEYQKAFTTNTKLVVLNHASNVTGSILPIEKFVKVAHQHGVKVLVDLSQTAGFLDIKISEWGVDFAAFTGHKSLLGLPGTGGLYVKNERELSTLIEGGTGVNSISLVQPGYMPEKFEAGTINYTGIAVLGACATHIMNTGLNKIRKHEYELLDYLLSELALLPEVQLIGSKNIRAKVPIVSFTVENMPSNEVATMLDNEYGIMTRPGLQCAPLAHQALGTSPNGTVRVSLGYNNTYDECMALIDAVKAIIRSHNN
mgnify:FL=1